MSVPLRTLMERAILRHVSQVTPETRMITAIFGQAISDVYAIGQDGERERRLSRYFLYRSERGVELATALDIDVDMLRDWVARLEQWREEQRAQAQALAA